MSVNVTIAGVVYPFPTEGDEGWGATVSSWAVAVSSQLLQRTGGSFSLSAEVDFGATFATKQVYLKSRTVNPASSGFLRLAKTDQLLWRNNLNDGNLPLGIDSSNNLTFNGHILTGSSGIVPVASGGTGLASYTSGDMIYASATTTLSKLGIGTNHYTLMSDGSAPGWGQIVNASVDAAAAIAYSKLALTGSIVNADVNASAAIAYSKLNLSGSIVNADVNASAAIAYSKLNLSGSIVNADVNASAAIAYSKLALTGSIVNADVSASAAIARTKVASGTNYVILANSSSGVMSENAALTPSRPIISDANGQLTTEATLATVRGGTNLSSYTTGDIIYAASSSVLAKLGIGSSGQRLTVSGGLPAWGSASAALSVVSKTTTYAILSTDDVVEGSGSAFTMTLPDAVANAGKAYELKKTDSSLTNIITIATTSSQTIISATSPTTTTLNTIGETLWVVSDGANWQVLCRYAPTVATSFTPTGAWNTGITYTGFYTRMGKMARIQVAVVCSTTPNSATLTVTLPVTIDSAALAQGTTGGGTWLGSGTIKNVSSTVYPVAVTYNSTTVVDVRVLNAAGTYGSWVAVDQATPITFNTNDSVQFVVEVPVSGWNG